MGQVRCVFFTEECQRKEPQAVSTCTHMHAHIGTYVCTYMHTHTYTFTHMLAYAHTYITLKYKRKVPG